MNSRTNIIYKKVYIEKFSTYKKFFKYLPINIINKLNTNICKKRKIEIIFTYILTKILLYKKYNIKDFILYYNEKNIPNIFIKNFIFNISISHSKNCIIVALNEFNQIGIDIEYKKRITKNLSKLNLFKIFSKQELSKIKSFKNFLKIWTMKESFLKCLKTGWNNYSNKITILNNLNVYNNDVYCIKSLNLINDYYIFLCEKLTK